MKKPLLISSAKNDVFRDLLQLQEAKAIKKQRRYLVSGEKVVTEVLRSEMQAIQSLILPEGFQNPGDRLRSQWDKIPHIFLAKSLFSEIDQFGTHFPLLVCALPEIEKWDAHAPPTGLEVLLTQGDPANLGAGIRSCVAFGAHSIVILKEAAHPFHPKAVRAAAGATFHAALKFGPSLHELSGPLLILDMHGESISEFSWPKNTRLLVGEEGPGLPDSVQGTRLHIPTQSTVESLNATVALSVALFSYRQRIR